MDHLIDFWGIKDNIGIPEISARAIVMFLILLVLIRISGMRPFAKGDAFDTLITILLGAVAARGIVGATPFLSTVAAAVALILVHKILAVATFYSKGIGRHIKGQCRLLYSNGSFIRKNMRKADLTENDIYEELRNSLHTDSLDKIREIYVERTGQISFIRD